MCIRDRKISTAQLEFHLSVFILLKFYALEAAESFDGLAGSGVLWEANV